MMKTGTYIRVVRRSHGIETVRFNFRSYEITTHGDKYVKVRWNENPEFIVDILDMQDHETAIGVCPFSLG